MHASFCNGAVVHHRLSPTPHRFKYQMSWCLFDLDSLDELFARSKVWSLNKFNIVSLRNKDYINASPDGIKAKAKAYIEKRTKHNFNGKIFLFTHPRYMGFGFNSVNFYFCYENNNLVYILSEINNTPWKQKHLYFHDVQDSKIDTKMRATEYVFEFQKEFHISPFVDMAIDYLWKFNINSENFSVSMQLKKQGKPLMHVNLKTTLTPILENDPFKWMLRKPFQALKMFAGIYWQAFKLWLKKVPFFIHPIKETKSKEIK
jgi:hypothetical protein